MGQLRRIRILLPLVTGLLLAQPSYADNLSQNFDSINWVDLGDFSSYVAESWAVSNIWVGGAGTSLGMPDFSGGNACWFDDFSVGTNSSITTPSLSNGVGTIGLYARSYMTGTNKFSIQTSSNRTVWITQRTFTNTSLTWSNYQCVLNDYTTGMYVRVYKTASFPAGQFLGVDSITLTNPPAKVIISGTTTVPDVPTIGNTVDITANLSQYGLVSSLTATSFWQYAGSSTWYAVQMTNAGAGLYRTSSKIPGPASPLTVNYYVAAFFSGPAAMSPTNSPTAGASAPYSFTFQMRGFLSDDDHVNIVGGLSTNTILIDDYLWQGVYSSATNMISPQFRFEAVNTNLTTTNYLGDTNQLTLWPPITGTAETNGASMVLGGTNSGQILLRLNETNLAYTARNCVFQNFSGWTTAGFTSTDTNNGWIVNSAYVFQDTARKLRDNACYLESNGVSSVQSTVLPDGVGEISFWYRNWSNGTPQASCLIQKSKVGGTNDQNWTTIDTLTSITTTNYGRYTRTINDRYNYYLRIRIATNQPNTRLCLDEIMVTSAGAGVVFTNNSYTPAMPSAYDPLYLYTEILPKAGASNLTPTAYYRTGSTGVINSLSMINVGTNMWRTSAAVPAGSGNGTSGVGNVQYYFACAFTGLESTLASPILSPETGSNSAFTATVVPAQIVFSNVTSSPAPAPVATPLQIVADITTLYGASNVAATAYYRINYTGAYVAVSMIQSGASNHYVTSTSIPAIDYPGTPVDYYIVAQFSGPSATTPVTNPASGTSVFLTHQNTYAANYTNVSITGSASTNMTLVADHTWVGTLTFTGTNSTFRFAGILGTTNFWGETNQPFTDMPVYGIAETNASNIIMGFTNSGTFLFKFDDSTHQYSIQRCNIMDFNSWVTAQTNAVITNNGWIVSNGRTTFTSDTNDTNRTFDQRSGFLASNGAPQYVQSPYLTNGVGEINFWYRNWETDASPATEFYVQTSKDGTSSWITVATVTNVLTADYARFSLSLSDRNRHGVRIMNSTNTIHAILCLDDIIVADPGPGVTITNALRNPSLPTVLDQVTISATILPLAHVTNVTPVVWYRMGTNGNFGNFVPMTNSTSTNFYTLPPIPRGDAGVVEYYVETYFSGLRTQDVLSVCYPTDGMYAPLKYTNTDLVVTQTFDSMNWGVFNGSSVDQTIEGWRASEAYFILDSPAPYSTNYALWLAAYSNGLYFDGASTNSYIMTPLLTNGCGTFSFYGYSYKATAEDRGGSTLSLFTSPNGTTTWTLLTNFSIRSPSWVGFSYFAGIESPCYMKLMTTAGDTDLAGIDSITCSLPPARVAITNTMIQPGYPASNQTVGVSCYIYSTNNIFPAVDITARVFYKPATTSVFSGPLEMTNSGSYYYTLSSIPAYPENTTIQYYIQSTFKGYHYTNRENMSPTYLPDAVAGSGTNSYFSVTSNYFSYVVRPFISDFSNVTTYAQLSGTNLSIQMVQLSDRTWQGILTLPTPETEVPVSLVGYGQDLGSNYWWSGSNLWGDALQSRTEIPYSSILTPGDTNVVIHGTNLGQFLVRFNETNLSYSIQRCVYQDFDTWLASSSTFEDSMSASTIKITTQEFEQWPTNRATHSILENFSSWDPPFNFRSGLLTNGNVGWVLYDSKIGSDMKSNVYAVFTNSPDNGQVRPIIDTLVDGLGEVNFEYRTANNPENTATSIFWTASTWTNVTVSAKMWARDIPTNATPMVLGSTALFDSCSMSVFARYTDPRNYYRMSISQMYDNSAFKVHVGLYRVKNGAQTEVDTSAVYYFTNTLPLGYHLITNPHTYKLVINNYTNDKSYVNFELSCDGQIMARGRDLNGLTNGGAVGFSSANLDLSLNNLLIGPSAYQSFRGWNSLTNIASTNVYGWFATNVSRVAFSSSDEFISLETNRTSRGPGYIQSPVLPLGVGDVTLRYSRDAGTGTNRCLIQWSTNATDWTDAVGFNFSSPTWTNFSFYSSNLNLPYSNVMLRIVNTNSGWRGTALYLDDICIGPNSNLCYYGIFTNASATNGWIDLGGKNAWNVNTNTNSLAYECPGYTLPNDPLVFIVETLPEEKAPLIEVDGEWTTQFTITNRAISWRTFNFNFKKPDKYFVRIKHKSGDGFMCIDNIDTVQWHGSLYNTDTNASIAWSNKWIATESWVVTNSAISPNTNFVELTVSRAHTNAEQYVRTPFLTNGAGVLSFDYRSADGNPVAFLIQRTDRSGNTNQWESTLLGAITNITSTNWANFSWSFTTNSTMFVRILHVSTNFTGTNTASLLLDNLKISDYSERDEFTWIGMNILLTNVQSATTFRIPNKASNTKSAVLNLNATSSVTPGRGPYTNDSPYIQSAYLTNGYGEISFWYRNWGSPTNGGTIDIVAAPSETWDHTNWLPVCSITNATNSTYKFFTYTTYDASNRYLRVYANTNGAPGRFTIDDLLITAPAGADLSMSNLTLYPDIPLQSDSVNVEITLYDFFMDVSSIQPTLRYYASSNNWGAWTVPTGVISMTQKTATARSRTYRTTSPIPQYPIDTVVQYYISCTYSGLFSQISSPKTYRKFSNPGWYYPTDLNASLGSVSNTMPYYFVFSCRPGTVWINEFNTLDPSLPYQFVELCGPAGADLRNWKLEVINNTSVPAVSTQSVYSVTNNTILSNMTNGWGFWVLADTGITPRDMTLTNMLPDNEDDGGTLRLRRSMGAYEDAATYGISPLAINMPANHPGQGFVWVGGGDSSWDSYSIQRIGTGVVSSAFIWVATAGYPDFTPGAVNVSQYLTETNNPLSITITLSNIILSTNVTLVFTVDGGSINPKPLYSTNLMNLTWATVTNPLSPPYVQSGNTYTQWITRMTNSPVYFYKIGTN